MVENATVRASDSLHSLCFVFRVDDSQAFRSWQTRVAQGFWCMWSIDTLLQVVHGYFAAGCASEREAIASGIVMKFSSVCNTLSHWIQIRVNED